MPASQEVAYYRGRLQVFTVPSPTTSALALSCHLPLDRTSCVANWPLLPAGPRHRSPPPLLLLLLARLTAGL
jgi:hypothetical protein